VSLEQGRVTFRYKDYADGAREKQLTLSAVEFLRRWLQHVLPRGLVKVRHYGRLANTQCQDKLAVCRRLLWPKVVVARLEVAPAALATTVCPCCGQQDWQRLGEVAAAPQGVAVVVGEDSS
jgi:hypothetical protein